MAVCVGGISGDTMMPKPPVCYVLEAIFKQTKQKQTNSCVPLLPLFVSKEVANLLKKC